MQRCFEMYYILEADNATYTIIINALPENYSAWEARHLYVRLIRNSTDAGSSSRYAVLDGLASDKGNAIDWDGVEKSISFHAD